MASVSVPSDPRPTSGAIPATCCSPLPASPTRDGLNSSTSASWCEVEMIMTPDTPARRIPLVDYLVLDPEPHLVAQECSECAARFFDRRDACAQCFGDDFRPVTISDTGTVVSFTIVSQARPGVSAPYVAAILDCGGTWVRANLRVAPDPGAVSLGMQVQLTTYSLGMDAEGTEAVGFVFAPSKP